MSAHHYQIDWRAYHRQWLQSGQPLLGFFKQSIHPVCPAVEFDDVVAAFKKLRGLIWSVELSTRPRRDPPRPNSLPSTVPIRVSADAPDGGCFVTIFVLEELPPLRLLRSAAPSRESRIPVCGGGISAAEFMRRARLMGGRHGN
ncbi:hypothetical protein [Sutterella sp.]|uniref:hypothetical protein n=1 Tax=Sutterella sp. TaxID=1981025 RepID=UPI003FD8859D